MSARETVERLWDEASADHSYTVDIAHMEKFARALALHLAGLCREKAFAGDCAAGHIEAFAGELK